MQQRQLRLGDILDDYCPRERRLANHTIVAMVGDEIRLTRCTTCDTEHPYKGGKAPRLRKKKTSVEAAYNEVLESVKQDSPAVVQPPVVASNDGHGNGVVSDPDPSVPAEPAVPTNGSGAQPPAEEIRLHRPLIRAQLPRIERDAAARPVPEFTVRQANKRQGRFQNAHSQGRFAKGGGSNRPGHSRGPAGPHGPRPAGGRPQGHGGRHQGGKKRSR
jgi:hypothetical protein